jgi:prevent-host-death family protein
MQLDIIQDICHITDFKTRAAKLLEQVKETKHPLLITQRGKTVAVVIDAEEYQKQQEQLELINAIFKGKEDMRAGRTHTHEEVMKEAEEWTK